MYVQLKTCSISDTKYCKSILKPTAYTLKQTLQSTFVHLKMDAVLDEEEGIDLCCRFLYKCDAHKRIEMNQTNTNVFPFWQCDCVRSFQKCLNNVNTTLSNEFAFIHSINTTKCISNDYPIVKCKIFEKYSDSVSHFIKLSNLNERQHYFTRCSAYELDQNRKKTPV